MKTFTLLFLPLIAICFFLGFKKDHSIGKQLAVSLKSEIYTDLDTLTFDSVFKSEFKILNAKYLNVGKLKQHYLNNGFKPNLVIRFFGDKGLDTLLTCISKSSEHGFNPKIFHNAEIASLIASLKANNFKSVNAAYPLVARLEILTADALARYVSYLKFGTVNPKEIFLRYNIEVKQPDSLFLSNLLNSERIADTLSALQHQSVQYKALQKYYLTEKNDSLKKILLVNMERLRWALPKTGSKFIQVNIPEFKLVYFDDADTLVDMKVCVGARRDLDYENQLKIYEKTGSIKDRPENRETPLLISNIKKFYTNPVWNIPESIAQTEVFNFARRNSSYLKRKNIAVYHKDKRIKNPGSIRWYKYSSEKLPFLFVQQPGPDNSLGKLKFIFPNKSSVYLHDTNFKQGFKLKNRAISHGCIRIEKPLKLAQLLVADTAKFNDVRKELNLVPSTAQKIKSKLIDDSKKELTPAMFAVPEETPLIITYFTAWFHANKINYRPDVYGMDDKLWNAMKKFR